MFEKEAKEYMHKDGTESEKLLNTIDLSLTKRQAFVLINICKQCFKDGAELGYNKGYHDAEEHYLNVIDSQHKLVDESREKEKEIIRNLIRPLTEEEKHLTIDVRHIWVEKAKEFLKE